MQTKPSENTSREEEYGNVGAALSSAQQVEFTPKNGLLFSHSIAG